jgi:hypothetical protein
MAKAEARQYRRSTTRGQKRSASLIKVSHLKAAPRGSHTVVSHHCLTLLHTSAGGRAATPHLPSGPPAEEHGTRQLAPSAPRQPKKHGHNSCGTKCTNEHTDTETGTAATALAQKPPRLAGTDVGAPAVTSRTVAAATHRLPRSGGVLYSQSVKHVFGLVGSMSHTGSGHVTP